MTQVGVLAELVNDDGSVKRGGDIEAFAAEHGLKMVSVADLIAYRQRSERLVERIAEFQIATHAGPALAIAYRTEWDAMQHLAIVFGDIRGGRDVFVRLHLESVADDVFGADSALDRIVERLAKTECGVIVYLREGSVGVARGGGRPRDQVTGDEHHQSAALRDAEWREIGLGAQILRDLGVTSIRLLASRERRYVGLDGFGIEIEATEIIDH